MPENMGDLNVPEIPTPEEAYRRSISYMEVADERVSMVGEYDPIAQFYVAKATIWAHLANVNSFGSVLLESGPPWVNYNTVTDEDLSEVKKSMMLGENEEEDDGRP